MVMDDSVREKHARRVYLDYAASTPVAEEVLRAMEPYWNREFGNAGGLHEEGRHAYSGLETSRKTLATLLGAGSDEVIFTGSGTESNNIAIFGVPSFLDRAGEGITKSHFITSVVEHPSVLDCFRELERRGAQVSYIGVDGDGLVLPAELEKALTPKTVLVSIMLVNNEIGTIHPITQIAKVIRAFRGHRATYPYFHTDASQALLYYPLDVRKLGVDLLSIDGQKIYGPKGVGALYKSRHVRLAPVLIGGGQEFGLRPGTENIPLVVGFAKALELAVGDRKREGKRITELRDYFVELLKLKVPQAEINGALKERIANNVNVSIRGMQSEYLVVLLDAKGIACGSRSACIRDGSQGSYVVSALHGDTERAVSSLRFTLGKDTTRQDIEYTVDAVQEITAKFDKSQ
jgi:cysteine desulfurase